MLNKSGESGHSNLVPYLAGKVFHFSLSIIMQVVGLLYMAFITFSYVPSIPNQIEGFYHEGMLQFARCLFCIY